MGSTDDINTADVRIQGLLERYFRLRSKDESPQNFAVHLDEDTLAAFTEGNLTMRESDPVVNHLSNCSFCRHKTAELVRLDLAFAETDDAAATVTAQQPSKVSEVLSGILSRLFGGGEAAVFAHEEKKNAEGEDNTEIKPEPEDKK